MVSSKSHLIIGGTSEKRLHKALEIIGVPHPHPDLCFVSPENSIGIDEIRELKARLAFKPFSLNFKAAVIHEAHKLTLEAQNALLKTLEEPPANTLVVLTAPDHDLLLPTVISRCFPTILPFETEILLTEKEEEDFAKRLEGLTTVGEKFQLAADLAADRAKAGEWLKKAVLVMRKSLLALNRQDLVKTIRQFETSRSLIEHNVNTRLVLENLFLNLSD